MTAPFLIAELSANHLGSLQRAMRIVAAAAAAGADAVKLQTFTPEQMADPGAKAPAGPWEGRSLLELYREACTPRAWHERLFRLCADLGLICFSSVFHPDDVEFLETLDCSMYKISSFELTDLALIRCAAETGKPLVLSTGMAKVGEIDAAVEAARAGGCVDLALLRCTSAYPSPATDAALATMRSMGEIWGCDVGLSDHSVGIGAAVAAAAIGASMIEKHLTIARSDGGPDAGFSMEPHEFAMMATECRRAAEAVGGVRFGPTDAEATNLSLRRRPGGKRAQHA